MAVVSCLLVGAHLGVGALSDLYGLREALILPVVGLVVGGLAFSRVPVLASPPEEAAHA